jgi:hypothetical protein
MLKTCLECGAKLDSRKCFHNSKFCSVVCQRKDSDRRRKDDGRKRESFIKYYEKHKDAYKLRAKIHREQKRFSGKREDALKRDNYKCQMCGSTERLEVHHKDNSGRCSKPNNSLENLQTLCSSCHSLVTNKNMGRYIDVDMEKVKQEMQGCNAISDLAEKLKINPITLAYKMRKKGISILHNKACEICGNEFEISGMYHYKKYCSPQCHAKAGHIEEQKRKDEKRVTVNRNCLNCGTEFEVNKFNPNQKFCNYNCGRRYVYREKKKK